VIFPLLYIKQLVFHYLPRARSVTANTMSSSKKTKLKAPKKQRSSSDEDVIPAFHELHIQQNLQQQLPGDYFQQQLPADFLQQQQFEAPMSQVPNGGFPPASCGCSQSNQADMSGAYNIGAAIAREQLSEEDRALLNTLDERAIVVVEGTYDHMDSVFRSLGLPFTFLRQDEVVGYNFRPEQTVYVNCANQFPADAAMRLQSFVREGGQLVTSDWALLNVIQVAFPGYVEFNGRATGDDVVAIEVSDPTHDLVQGFLPRGTAAPTSADDAPQWWLESQSYPIRILRHDAVRVLIRSSEMARKYGHNDARDDGSAILIEFNYGDGSVVHMVSHFYLQRSETRGERHAASAAVFAEAMLGETAVQSAAIQEVMQQNSGVNYAQVQSATTSSAFVYKSAAKQARKTAQPKASSASSAASSSSAM
jgi:hypothetical protein